MKKYISEYLNMMTGFIESQKKSPDAAEIAKFLGEFDKKIAWFMHERFIHLVVTVLFALMEVISLAAFILSANLALLILSLMFLVLVVPYVFHYYFLENSVQKLWMMRDELIDITEKLKSGSERA